MNEQDPPPLADPGSGAPPFLRDALRAARDELPRPQEVARLAARLPLALPVAAAAPPSVLSGALVGAALGLIVAGAGLFWDARPESPAPTQTPAANAAAPRPLPSTRAAEEPRSEVEGAAARRAIARSLPTPPAPPALPASAEAIAPAAPVPASEAASALPTGGPAGAGPIGRDELPSEVDLIVRAREKVGPSPSEALALTEEHARRFPRGMLAEEREVLVIESLRGLGRTDEARARRDRFLSAYPRSVYRARLEARLGP